MTPSARLQAAIELLEETLSADRRPADAIANAFFRERRFIGSGDRRAVSDRAWGVLRARRRLGWWLDRGGAVAAPRLLVAASLLLEGWTFEGVEKSFSGGQFAAAPLNATEKSVLRPLETRTLDHPDMPEPVRLEIPDWIFPHLQTRFGVELAAEMAAMAEPAPLDLRVNLLKSSLAEAKAALAAEGVEAVPTRYSPWGLRVAHRRPVTSGGAFQTGILEIQDEGSQLVAHLVGALPGMRVVDWCAGAGGKTLAIAMTMENKGSIVACDVSEKRLEAAVKRLRRAGVHNVERHLTEDGDKWVKRRAQKFDRVLVDAPCTGTGTWRRNPDGRLRLTETDLAELLPKQARILDAAERLVRPGGRLIYATCSLLREENEAQIEAFCARYPEYSVVPVSEAWALSGVPPCPDPFLVLTPLRHGTDGFFTAILERAAVQSGAAA